MTEISTDIEKKRERYKFVLSQVYNLPSIPVVMLEVNKLLDNPMTSAAELGKVISKDQGMVTKILTVANSPLYGLPRRVSTIDFAIIILGFDHIKNIVIALSMIEAFKNKSDKNLDHKKYWIHSFLTATAAKRIADDLGYHVTGEAFTAGLLHDLGIPVIHKYLHTDFIKICELVEKQGFSYQDAQQEILALSHSEIGYHLACKWNLPLSLSDVILNHHSPGNSDQNKMLSAIVHIADYMTFKLEVGNFIWDDNYELDPAVFKILNISEDTFVDKFVLKYKDLFENQINSLKF